MSFMLSLPQVLQISHAELSQLLLVAPQAYKTYNINKRSGGKRQISQPTPAVKNAQRSICSIFLSKFEISSAAMAYRKGYSIKENASAHLGKKFILKMDFRNFFPSLKPDDLLIALKSQNYIPSSLEQYALERILFKNTSKGLRLTIGAPSSPLISNLIMKAIDDELQKFTNDNDVIFTRYADDLTFSFNDVGLSEKIQTRLGQILQQTSSPRLQINHTKTHLIGKGRSQRVTGIVLTHEEKVSASRYKRKKIRAMCHNLNNNTLKKDDMPYLHGLISHVRDIEPEFYTKLLQKYGHEFFQTLAKESFNAKKSRE